MAAAGRGDRLNVRRRRPPLPLRVLRGLAALSVLGLAGLVGYEALRAAGFRFRWEDRGELLPPELEPLGALTADRARGASPGSASGPGDPSSRDGDSGLSARQAGAALDGSGSGAADVLDSGTVGADAAERAVAGERPVGQGDFASIDFEAFGDGRPFCTNCPVSDQWVAQGLVVSFRSWSASSTRPFVLDARNFLPPNASKHALGPALASELGLEVGVLVLEFPGRPRKVAFTLYGPDLIERFSVVPSTGGRKLPAGATLSRVETRYNPAGRGPFRAERVLVQSASGIDRIELDGWGPPGHVLLVDNLGIDP